MTIPPDVCSYIATAVTKQQLPPASGDHVIFIGGTGDTLTATGATESIMGFLGAN
jgi:hypothetical protein